MIRTLVFLFVISLASTVLSLLPADLVARPNWLNLRTVGPVTVALGLSCLFFFIRRRRKESREDAELREKGLLGGV